jgi:DNA-binding CsgD family transcriptional regulator
MRRARSTRSLASDIPAPLGLRASRISVAGEDLTVFSFPLAPPALPPGLSAAERAVAMDLLEGKSNGEIAAARCTSVRTVANQISSLFKKLRVHSRSQLVALLARHRVS